MTKSANEPKLNINGIAVGAEKQANADISTRQDEDEPKTKGNNVVVLIRWLLFHRLASRGLGALS